MNLLLWRHADAEEGSPDVARALTRKGHEQAASVAHWLKRQLPPHPRILVSPARRARETAEALGLPYQVERALAPGADPATVLELVEGLPEARETVSCVVLVGHQPWIGEVAARLISGGQASWSVRKAAVWWLVRRMRSGEAQWTVRTVTDPDYS